MLTFFAVLQEETYHRIRKYVKLCPSVVRINSHVVPKGTSRGRTHYSTNIKSLRDTWAAELCIVSSEAFGVRQRKDANFG